MSNAREKLAALAARIREMWPKSSYKNEPYLCVREDHLAVEQSEDFRVNYCCFKYAVAKVLQPKTICEIGFGGGNAARAFLTACPDAHYLAIDNLQVEADRIPGSVTKTVAWLRELFPNIKLVVADTSELSDLPCEQYDLVHVDANHTYDYAKHDITMALRSGARFVLVNDIHDADVSRALAIAVNNHPDFLTESFPHTITGNALVARVDALDWM